MRCDILIRGGMIYDGSGDEPYRGDVAVSQGRIVGVCSSLPNSAEQTIDATGLAVCPGFIDPHTHEELSAMMGDSFESFLRQGVTTVVGGNCGHSITPGTAGDIYEYMAEIGLISQKTRERYLRNRPGWTGIDGFAQQLRKNGGQNINLALLLGHGTIRWQVMNGFVDRKPTREELHRMQTVIREGMRQGAVGLSTGLAYIPGRYADEEELVALARTVKECDGIMTSHLRLQEGDIPALEEAIRITERSGVRFQVSHYSPEYPEGFQMVTDACMRGFEMGLDLIPKSSAHIKRIDAFIALAIGNSDRLAGKDINAFYEALHTEEGRRDILDSIRYRDQIRVIKTGNANMEFRLVSEIAAERGVSADGLLLDLLEHGGAELSFLQGELVRRSAPGNPFTGAVRDCKVMSAGSDHIMGDAGDLECWYALFRNGAFPIFFDCGRKGGLSNEEMVRRVTSNVAERFRFTDRGRLAPNYRADITILDFDKFTFPPTEQIDYRDPCRMAEGVKTVLVNGVVTLLNGRMLEARSGQCISAYGKTI